ncbi:MAG TPA: M28 family peptidase [Cytophagales bacterium]
MKRFFSFLFLVCLTATAAVAQTPSLDKPVAQALRTVKPKALKAHVQYLADDRLRGRMPGTEGYQLAVDYVTGQLRDMGVAPAGENGTYLQRVRLRNARLAEGATLALGEAMPLAAGRDYVIFPNPRQAEVTLDAPVVFAGYGISAPALGYDDYAGLDARGKWVLVLRGAPEKFPSTVAAHSQNLATLQETAVRHGAVGVLIGSGADSLPRSAAGIHSVLGPDGNLAVASYYASDSIRCVALVRRSVLAGLLKAAGQDLPKVLASLKAGRPASVALVPSLRAAYRSVHRDFDSYNVVGRVAGADPQLQNEYLVHSAHLDHLGVGAPVNGDSIYNGAHDNASGVASILEIARLYTRLEGKPRRSVLFVLVTGEEMGLLGSGYFARYPTVPAASIVANVNTDMPTLIAPLRSAVALGAGHSSLQNQVSEACQYLGIALEADPEPEQNRFIRSDQYSFVAQGIPALHIKYGNQTADGQNNLNVQVQAWRAKYYHQPQDEINGTFDWNAGRTYVQLNFLIGYLVAQSPDRPTWNPGDFFGERARP